MTDLSLTIQAFLDDSWQDIAKLIFNDDKELIELIYSDETTSLSQDNKGSDNYSYEHFLADNHFAVSINYPVELFGTTITEGWLPVLDDMIPAGASRRYWMQRLDLTRLSKAEQDYELLRRATIAPIGHLRIKEAVPLPTQDEQRLFTLADITDRDVNFLEYASEQGAMAGGATGAGGEAPKLLLRWRDDEAIWIDNQQLADSEDRYYLVKYPRGQRTSLDCDILRAEYHYYHELTAMGFKTIDIDGMRLIEGDRYPSLWLPRFDIQIGQSASPYKRFAMESIYSMLKKGAGAMLDHYAVIHELIALIESSNMVDEGFYFDKQAFVIEWVQRDLLNIAFGNSDNHGRNHAFMRDADQIWLTPIYDFAPMRADPEGIPRSIKWKTVDAWSSDKLESGGRYRFDLIAEQLADIVPPEVLLGELNTTAKNLLNLKTRLAARGVPERILSFPAIGFDYLPQNLEAWRLLN